MPGKKNGKKKINKVRLAPSQMFEKASRQTATRLYQSKLRERKQWLENFPFSSTDQVDFVKQPGFNPTFMNIDQISYVFQWLLFRMGTKTKNWRVDINVSVPVAYFGAAVSALGAFHERMPEDVVVVDPNSISIATPGFDSLYAPNTPRNKVYSPSKIRKIARNVLDMDDENRTILSEQLRQEGIEIFRWGAEGAVPYRSEVSTPMRKKKKLRRVSW